MHGLKNLLNRYPKLQSLPLNLSYAKFDLYGIQIDGYFSPQQLDTLLNVYYEVLTDFNTYMVTVFREAPQLTEKHNSCFWDAFLQGTSPTDAVELYKNYKLCTS